MPVSCSLHTVFSGWGKPMRIPPIDTEAIAFYASSNEYGKSLVHVFICAACGTITAMDSPYYCDKCNRPICMGCAMCATECEHRTRKGIYQPPRLGRAKTEQLDKLLDKLISERNKLC